MGLFKKKIRENTCSGCSEHCENAITKDHSLVKILGSGCAKCNQLESATRQALKQLEMDTDIEHVTDVVRIAQYGVMSTPALVVNGKVVSCGKVLKVEEVVEILQRKKQVSYLCE